MTMAKSTKPDGWTTATRKGRKTSTVQVEWKRRMGMKKLQEEIEKSKQREGKMDITSEEEKRDEVRIKQEIIDESNAFGILSDDEEDDECNDMTMNEYEEIEVSSDGESEGNTEDIENGAKTNDNHASHEITQSEKEKQNKYDSSQLNKDMLDALGKVEEDHKVTNNKNKNKKNNKVTSNNFENDEKSSENQWEKDNDDEMMETDGNEETSKHTNRNKNQDYDDNERRNDNTATEVSNADTNKRYTGKGTELTADEETVKELLKKRGETLIEERAVRYTKVKFEFNIAKDTLTFNIRKAFVNIIKELRKEDSKLKVKSCINNQEWGYEDELPIDEKFHQHFATKEQIYTYSANKAFAYTTVMTHVPFYTLKWKSNIIEYLKENKIWIKEDYFSTELTSSPGYFTNVHYKATWKDTFAAEIIHGLRKIKLNKENTIVKAWDAQNVRKDTDFIPAEVEKVPIPRFVLNNTVRKWGKVSTEVIGIECDKKDAQYMKHILSVGAEQEVFGHAVFVPVGFHLIQGKYALEELLRQNNIFLSELTIIPIEGISRDTMKVKVVNNKTLEEKLKECNGIYKIEECAQTEEKGKWLIVAQRNKINQVKQHVESKLNEIYQRGVGQTKMVGFTKMKQKREGKNAVVGTYAEVLKRMACNYDYSGSGQAKEDYDTSHYQRRKRKNIKVDLTTTDKSKKRNDNESGISTMTLDSNVLEERIERLEKKLNENNERNNNSKIGINEKSDIKIVKKEIVNEITEIIDKKMTQFESKQDEKIAEITKSISKTISEGIMEVVTEKMETKFEGYMSKILKAVEKQVPDHHQAIEPKQSQQDQLYTPTHPGYLNHITPQQITSPAHLETPLRFADPRFAYTPTQHILGGHQELARGPN